MKPIILCDECGKNVKGSIFGKVGIDIASMAFCSTDCLAMFSDGLAQGGVSLGMHLHINEEPNVIY